ncbi:hypothetical protein FLAVO9AF_70051 [Flavobacterium sp. 9AF]|uniref:hypothetical protein n=1 Tax=Flavobacterium sp. 9AF TaxID=2653142 RepID=UPI0012F1C53E|nr:hypothetical protein [Flavobacterium sp. 9AF]VXC21661.1 hypothetical protein FLAVO9AF_70051 [Flavobacterium sp. 9AF]
MQKLISKNLFLLIICSIFILGCKTNSKNNHKKNLEYLNNTDDYVSKEYIDKIKESSSNVNKDSIRINTSDFYDIKIISHPQKKVFDLEEKKNFSMQITNYGTKELYLPEWFRANGDFSNVEMTIEIYKMGKNHFEKYVQKSMTTQTFVHPAINEPKRVVLETNKGKHLKYENIQIDTYKKIVDEGLYKARVHIDISNFGYFNALETEFIFEIIK